MEDVCHMRVSKLLQREWELKSSHLLQEQGETEGVCCRGVSHVWVFVVREICICFKDRGNRKCLL